MLRWTGLLAAVVSAVLVGLLVRRTERAEVRGTLQVNSVKHLFPERSPITLRVRTAAGLDSGPETDRLVATGLNLSGIEEKEDGEVVAWIWEVEIPEGVVRRAKPGEEGVITVRRLEVDGVDGDYVRLLRYHFRRGTDAWSESGAGNWKFLTVYALACGVPLLLWGLLAGGVALCSLARMKSSIREP